MSTPIVSDRTRSRTRHTLATALAALVVTPAVLVGAIAGPASADAEYDDAVELSWDDGATYAATTLETFFDGPVLVPGDLTSRTLMVRNEGPTDGTLRVTITGVELLDRDAVDEGNFYDDTSVQWAAGSASLTELADAGQTRILEMDLAQGESVPVELGYDFPGERISGNAANVSQRLASLDVVIELGGDLPEVTTPGGTTLPEAPHPGILPSTGAGIGWPVVLAALLTLALGSALVAASSRRRAVTMEQPQG